MFARSVSCAVRSTARILAPARSASTSAAASSAAAAVATGATPSIAALRAATQQVARLSTAATARGSSATAAVSDHAQFATEASSSTPKHAAATGVRQVIPMGSQSLKCAWADGKAAEFHYIWLRDNCHCPACRHPVTHQKVLDTPSLPINIEPASLRVNADGNVDIVWNNDGHKSTYDAAFLRQNMYSLYETRPPTNSTRKENMTLWDQNIIESQLPIMEYSELATDDKGVLKWLKMLERYGVAVVRGSPAEKEQVLAMGRRIAHIKETSYGLLFDVLNEPRPGAHLAYTGVELKHHSDMNYMEKSPGIQILHCIRADATGGESVFVDGFWIAEWLRKTDPTAFQVLSSIDVGFGIKNGDHSYINHVPIFCADRNQEVYEVHVNNRTMQPLISHPDAIVPFYSAFRQINEKMRERASEWRLDMRAGDVVAFNNRRVLHGRTSFDPSSGVRHLQGCYIDRDDFASRMRQLMAKHASH
ncbi:gamma-butyrobetaine dioxygenase [Capsaspora owczarzaki ATCC 30864]|uniref:Gamma-butyrobetaine dioxygenase n=1 Tax=Capsaspora owczarzaki (strain ATCC 30864) TaxID=595528 RepID=A0A0D2U129_CAPO3|nr:gamma-butyrobetaine dioxygenase [Capsaspora owczarzaki ATCC 30864]KJE88931.1 gamma-butyrobetaine dioxygenase [Capsaspora owczarzaki ATCC 30864]|eukprot:XP_004365370.1 gamma-butyrobetaine dioxygenase [Capsaspora owczarzaki ATCC 30864]